MPDGTEPISDDEWLYRRVFAGSGYFKPDRQPSLSDKAFQPAPQDVDGISFTRASYVESPQSAASTGYLGKQYYVIKIRAGDLKRLGISIHPKPTAEDIGHAVIPEMNRSNLESGDKSEMVLTAMNSARNLPYEWYGPFAGTKPPPPSKS